MLFQKLLLLENFLHFLALCIVVIKVLKSRFIPFVQNLGVFLLYFILSILVYFSGTVIMSEVKTLSTIHAYDFFALITRYILKLT